MGISKEKIFDLVRSLLYKTASWLFLFFISFFISFYLDLEFWGLIFIIISALFLNYIRDISLRGLIIFVLILSFFSVFWIYFIVDYVGIFFTVLALLISTLVFAMLLFFVFLPFLFFKKFRESKRELVFAFFYSLYFVLWNYVFFRMDDLCLSFWQLYFTQSKNYLLYPVFSVSPFIVTFITLFSVFVFYYLFSRKRFFLFFSFFLILLFFNFVFRFYYLNVSKLRIDELERKLSSEKVVAFFISTDTVAMPPDYRIRNESMAYYKCAVAIALANSIDKEGYKFLFFLPEGSFSKNEKYLFNPRNPNSSSSLYNLGLNMKNLLSYQNYSIMYRSFIFFNPTSIDHEKKQIFNSVVLINLSDVLNLSVNNYQIYDKIFLVPFAEKTPEFFKSFASFFSKWIVVFRYLDYTPGKEEKVFSISEKLKFKPLVCFESFKYLGIKERDEDYEFIVVTSNDSWFVSKNGKNFIFYLHLKSVKMLSVAKKKTVFFLVNGDRNRVFVFFDRTRIFERSKSIIIF